MCKKIGENNLAKKSLWIFWHIPHSLKDSNASPKMKTTKKGVTLPGSQHFKSKKGVLKLQDGD